MAPPLEEAAPAPAYEHEQLRLDALELSFARRGSELEERRVRVTSRKAWLIEVGKTTEAHRRWMAARHAMRAWYALQPQNEPAKLKPLGKPAKTPTLRWCTCEDNKIEIDPIFGVMNEPDTIDEPDTVWKRCAREGCARPIRPHDWHSWFEYAAELVERSEKEWCGCGEYAVHRRHESGVDYCSGDTRATVDRSDDKNLTPALREELEAFYRTAQPGALPFGGKGCGGPIAPDTLRDPEASIARQCEAIVATFYGPVHIRLTRLVEEHARRDDHAKQTTGYGLDDSPEQRLDVYNQLREAIGVEPLSMEAFHEQPADPAHEKHRQRRPDCDGDSGAEHTRWIFDAPPTPKPPRLRGPIATHAIEPGEEERLDGDPEAPRISDDGQKVLGDPEAPHGSITGYEWHKAREKGQHEKLDRVLQCGSDTMLHRCTACSKQGPKIKLTCGNHRLCITCRAARVQKFQRRFCDAQRALMQQLWNDPLRLQKSQTRTVYEEIELNSEHLRWSAQMPEKGSLRSEFSEWRSAEPDRIAGPAALCSRKVLRYGGRWSEKFLTLTLPHSGNVTQDVRELQRAWRKFWRLLRMHIDKDLLRHEPKAIRKRLLKEYVRYCRVIEVEPGNDWHGHAHMHLWYVAPFIDHSVIAHLWGSSLSESYRRLLAGACTKQDQEDPERTQRRCIESVDEVIAAMPESRRRYADQLRSFFVTRRGRAGRQLTHVWRPVIDVRKVQSDGIGAELCKYLVKDGERNKETGKLEMLQPELFAMIYAALEGTRAICSSRGLLLQLESTCHCQDCGGVFVRWIKPTTEQPDARGPPSDQLELGLELHKETDHGISN